MMAPETRDSVLCPASDSIRKVVEGVMADGLKVLLDVLLEVEAAAYVAQFSHCRDANGRALVVRNGSACDRRVPMGPVSFSVRAPRVNDRREVDGQRQKFVSRVLSARKSPSVGGV